MTDDLGVTECLRDEWVKALNKRKDTPEFHPWEALDVSGKKGCIAGVSCRSTLTSRWMQLAIQGLYYGLSYYIDVDGNPQNTQVDWFYGEITAGSPLIPYELDCIPLESLADALGEARDDFPAYFEDVSKRVYTHFPIGGERG